jgi:hypothetical protein
LPCGNKTRRAKGKDDISAGGEFSGIFAKQAIVAFGGTHEKDTLLAAEFAAQPLIDEALTILAKHAWNEYADFPWRACLLRVRVKRRRRNCRGTDECDE